MPSSWPRSLRIGAGLFALALAFAALAAALPARAAMPLQFTPFPTPTPGADGRIIYLVQPNDTLWRISAITGVSTDQLRSLNHLQNDILVPGQELLLGLAGPAEITPTAGPTSTPRPSRPTSSPQPGSGTLCVLVFNDLNGDSLRQEEEPSIADGAVSVTDRLGKISLTHNTIAGSEPYCFEEVPEGEYNISVAVPDGYNPTTALNYALAVEPGMETFLDFGAQLSSEALAEAPAPTGGGKSPLLGLLGGLLLLGGLGLGVYAGWMGRLQSKKSEKLGD